MKTPATTSPRIPSQLVRAGFFFFVLGLVSLACKTGADAETGQTDDPIAETLDDDNAPLLVRDPRTLVALEKSGLALSAILGADGESGTSLYATPRFKLIADTIAEDLRVAKLQDPKSGVGIQFPHRQFDASWLQSKETRFELVGIVNRLDRRHVAGCGELRLVYRLAYTASRSASRLPMTVNVVFPQADDGAGCTTVAQRWLDAKSGTPEALLAGPLAGRAAIGAIEVNLQSVRWPSNERPEFGGHAEYILRVFAAKRDEGDEGDTLEPAPLENTPRSDLDDAEKEELRTWIGAHLDAIDDGTAVIPAKFLVTKAISVGPSGLARDANRPFSRIFGDAAGAFGALPLAATKQIGSPAALLRRLDTMTCNGCHQARSIAGFHLLGEERDNDARLNALTLGRSPHFDGELAWRTAFLAAVVAGGPSAPRPFAERTTTEGKYGAHCGLGDAGFAAWSCTDGLECLDLHHDAIGICSPAEAPVGDACRAGTVTHSPNPRLDHVIDTRELACNQDGSGARCDPVTKGFPDGMCRVDCAAADVGKVTGETICGEIPDANGLTSCLAAGRPFADCLSSQNTLTNLRTCDATEQCRDDYACTRVRNGPPGIGACMPPYFAFQARVDGHLVDP